MLHHFKPIFVGLRSAEILLNSDFTFDLQWEEKKTKSSGNEDLGFILSFPRGFKIASKQIPITQFEDFVAR